jgi:isoquinoline 1-oxidoreductase beta subunit
LVPERGKAVIRLVAEKAAWGTPLPEGWGRGIAYFATFDVTHVAQVAEVSITPEAEVRVHRVVCAVDCGTVINPDTVVAQMEGGIVFGLTAALKADITVENGRVQQSNFHDYPLLRIDEMPAVEVHIAPSAAQPSGIGEMGVPPIAPAIANAIFAATGKRVRHLPIRAEDLV